MTSKKQIQANRKNAQKSTGPKTEEGKIISYRNSLKHGLLAKEVVITDGEGVENQQAFDDLLNDLVKQRKPVGALEEMLVEKIAVSYWRQRRANQYEIGSIRKDMDTLTDDYYKKHSHKEDTEILEEIDKLQNLIDAFEIDLKKLSHLYSKGANLEEIYDENIIWERLRDEFYNYTDDCLTPKEIREILNTKDFSDERIWQEHIIICEDQINESQKTIEKLKKDKAKNKLNLQIIKKSAALPTKFDMDKLLRYETAIERQLYKAMNQLERLQRLRAGDHVPAPVQVDLNTLGSGDVNISNKDS
jgi:hypothetical protein